LVIFQMPNQEKRKNGHVLCEHIPKKNNRGTVDVYPE